MNHGLGKYFIQPLIVNLGALLFFLTNASSSSLIISDPQGCYVIVSGTLYQTLVVLANIYLDNPNFISLFSKIPNLDTHHLIVGGDLNQT